MADESSEASVSFFPPGFMPEGYFPEGYFPGDESSEAPALIASIPSARVISVPALSRVIVIQ